MYMYINNTIRGLFLLILAVAGNFLSETLSCPTQKLLHTSVFGKHFVLVTILYFSIHFTKQADHIHPWRLLIMSMIIYVFFLLFSKMELYWTAIVFIILSILFILSTFIDYYNFKKRHKVVKALEMIQKILIGIMFLSTLYGFATYFQRQYEEHSEDFSYVKFLFGTVKCKSLED